MQPDVIVYIDSDSKKIVLYGDKKTSIPFNRFYLLDYLLRDKTIVLLESGKNIKSTTLVKTFSKTIEPDLDIYLRYKGKNYLKIHDLLLTFAGNIDCKSVKKIGFQKFFDSEQLRNEIVAGNVDILTEQEATELKSKRKRASRDDELKSMIVDRNKMDPNSMFEDMFAESNDASGDENAMTENQRLAKELNLEE